MVSDAEFEVNSFSRAGARNKKLFLMGNYQWHVAMSESITVFWRPDYFRYFSEPTIQLTWRLILVLELYKDKKNFSWNLGLCRRTPFFFYIKLCVT